MVCFVRNGEITIPVSLRTQFGVTEGTKASVSSNGKSILLTPVTENHIKKARGLLKDAGILKSLMERKRREREMK